jgi:DNA-binding NarL/FixJ family response regulator
VRPTASHAEHDPPLDLSLLVVEPRDLVRHGVRLTLEHAEAAAVAHVSTGARALDVAASGKPDMVILSATLPDMSCAEATRRILSLLPRAQVLVLGDAGESEAVLEALAEGASGHLPALCTPEELVARVRLVRSGGVPLSRDVVEKLWERLRTEPRQTGPEHALEVGSLSAREVEVLRLLPTGMENADIARALSVSTTTVKKHVSSILEKLDVDNRVQAAVRAVRGGIEARVSRGLSGYS